MCLISEMVHSCSNEKVAQAAVASIGRDFAGKVQASARARGMSVGAFAAQTVIRFNETCKGEDKQALRRIMAGADQPILTALRHILEPAVKKSLPMTEVA